MPENENQVNFSEKDVPSQEDQAKLMDSVRGLLNPDGTNQQMDQYINSTFSYIGGMLSKVATAQDKDKASHEVAEDIVGKLKSWVESKQKEADEKAEGTEGASEEKTGGDSEAKDSANGK